jgi:hypothetical protein
MARVKLRKPVTLEHSGIVLKHVHSKLDCKGPYCTVHKMSDHHMRSFPQIWNPIVVAMQRVCEHGKRHTDPDEINNDIFVKMDHDSDCDGCCVQNG